jgi:hypothetical protein
MEDFGMIKYSFKMSAVVAGVLLIVPCAKAQQSSLRAGSYRCFIADAIPSSPTIDARDPDWRRSQGLPDLEQGQRATPPRQESMMMITPAFFGNIVIDGKGGYRLTGTGKTGRYGFNSQTSVPTFTGDLAIMKVRGYNSYRGRFFLVYDSLGFQCGLQGAPVANQTRPARPAPAPLPVPDRGLAGSAAAFTGRFNGTYACNEGTETLRLDTKAANNGIMVAVFQFGGTGSSPAGIFTLQGKWSKTGFALTPYEWVKQPKPEYEMTGLEGTITANGLSGRVVHNQCSTFDLERDRSVRN